MANSNPDVDNLYLDMNGIIHPCSHPQGNCNVPLPTCEDDMFENIKWYINLILDVVAPK